MGVVAEISEIVDNVLENYVQNVFAAVAEPVTTLLHAIALVALLFIAVNQLIQFRPVNYSTYLQWFVRYILIYSFATIWANFEGIYTLLIEIPGDYVALLIESVALALRTPDPDILDPSRIKDANTGIDEFAHAMFAIGNQFINDFSIFNLARSFRNVLIGLAVIIMAVIFVAAGAIILVVGKIGFALALSFAPLAIIMLMMPQSSQHFESWTRFTMGFALIPLLTQGLMAIVLYIGAEALMLGTRNDDIIKYVMFLMIMLSALVLMFQIPTMASTLAAASVAAVGAGAAFAAARMMKGGAMKAFSGMQRGRDAMQVAGNATRAGASPAGIASSVISGMRQSAAMRAQRRDERMAGRMSGDQTRRPRRAQTIGSGDSSGSGSGSSGDSAEQQNLNRDS